MALETLRIDGMHCGACVRRVTMALNKVSGTVANEVQVGIARVDTTATAEELVGALAKAGFSAHVE